MTNHGTHIRKLRNQLEQHKGQEKQIQAEIQFTEQNLKIEYRKSNRCERAIEIVKQVGLETQKQLQYHLAEQVSLAQAAVFDDPYELKVNFQEKRGKTEAELLYTKRGFEMKPIGSVGGGAIDVGSFALRLAYWTMRQDKKTRSVLLLDEPFARLKGEDANRRALALLNEISQKLEIQIIMVSDERIPREDIIEHADQVFLVTQKRGGGKSIVKQIKDIKNTKASK